MPVSSCGRSGQARAARQALCWRVYVKGGQLLCLKKRDYCSSSMALPTMSHEAAANHQGLGLPVSQPGEARNRSPRPPGTGQSRARPPAPHSAPCGRSGQDAGAGTCKGWAGGLGLEALQVACACGATVLHGLAGRRTRPSTACQVLPGQCSLSQSMRSLISGCPWAKKSSRARHVARPETDRRRVKAGVRGLVLKPGSRPVEGRSRSSPSGCWVGQEGQLAGNRVMGAQQARDRSKEAVLGVAERFPGPSSRCRKQAVRR